MMNEVAPREIERLQKMYEERWGITPDTSILPRSVTQERLCLILRRIIDTGESCLVGYNKVKDISLDYYFKKIDWSIQYQDGDVLEQKCPFCGKNVKITFLGEYNQSSVVYCEMDFCLRIESRGL